MSEQNEQQKKKTVGTLLPLCVVLALIAGMGGLLRSAWLDGKKTGEDTSTRSFKNSLVASPAYFDYRDSPPVVLKDHKFTDALDYAVGRWQFELPRYTVKRPELYQGQANNCWEGSNAQTIACADSKNYRITIQESQMDSKIDWQSIMLHEVGHLLGVPHIQGDALMDSGYTHKVESPTAFSIAIAKIALQGKE